MNRIRLSADANCAAERYCFPQGSPREKRQQWIDAHDLFVDDNRRPFALVDTASQVYFMDAVTGSLYQFGTCLTTYQLTNKRLVRDKARATELLLSLNNKVDNVDEIA